MVNKHIRCISRVIIEPRYRGLGLASRLVAETMGKLGVPIIEAMAVMGRVNPFFEKAGMKRYEGRPVARSVQLIEAVGMVGIDERELVNPAAVQAKLDGLGKSEAAFIEQQMDIFLQAYGRRREMRAGIERTRYVLSKLTGRPVYYIWFNRDKEFVVRSS
jgi:GNAT superfamily N-acetyltransferase